MSATSQLKKEILDAYVYLRTHNMSIPSSTLEFMKDAAIDKLNSSVSVYSKNGLWGVIDNDERGSVPPSHHDPTLAILEWKHHQEDNLKSAAHLKYLKSSRTKSEITAIVEKLLTNQ